MNRRQLLRTGAASLAMPFAAPPSSSVRGAEGNPSGVANHTAVQKVCAWPNLKRLPDGTLVVFIFNQPCHGLWEGDLDCWASEDNGKTWRFRSRTAQHEPTTNRMNCAAGFAKNGDLVVLCSGWSNRAPGRNVEWPEKPGAAALGMPIVGWWPNLVCGYEVSGGARDGSGPRQRPDPVRGYPNRCGRLSVHGGIPQQGRHARGLPGAQPRRRPKLDGIGSAESGWQRNGHPPHGWRAVARGFTRIS